MQGAPPRRPSLTRPSIRPMDRSTKAVSEPENTPERINSTSNMTSSVMNSTDRPLDHGLAVRPAQTDGAKGAKRQRFQAAYEQ